MEVDAVHEEAEAAEAVAAEAAADAAADAGDYQIMPRQEEQISEVFMAQGFLLELLRRCKLGYTGVVKLGES